MRKRLFPALLSVMMLLTLLPVTTLAADGPKTYTFTSSQTFDEKDLRANVYFKGDTIVFTPDAFEPFLPTDKGVCHTSNVGLRFCDMNGADVTGGICSVNTYSSDGSGCMVSFTITSDNPLTLYYKGAGPTGIQTPHPDPEDNWYAYRYHQLGFDAHPTNYAIDYDLDSFGSWPSGASYPTSFSLDGNNGTYTLQIPTPQSNDSDWYFHSWKVSENARILGISNLAESYYPMSAYPVNGVTDLALFIGFKGTGTGSRTGTEGFTLTAVWSNGARAAAPSFSLSGGNYASTQSVTLSCTTPNTTIYYTTDGSIPSVFTSTAYTAPIEVSSTTTITAKAFPPASVSMGSSEAVSETYTIGAPSVENVATPTFNPTAGTYTSAQSVTLSCATTGATIRYTTNGSEPTSSSPVYSSAITVSSATTIKAKAFKDGMTASAVATASYTITSPPDPDPDPTPTGYPILEGANCRWIPDSAGGLTIRVNGDYTKFQSVSVDGSIIDSGKYTSEPGSTIVTLKAAYLDALSAGGHRLRINFADGYAETTFTVATREMDVLPQTGGSSNTTLWVALLLIGGAGVIGASIYFKKKKSITE